MISEHDLEVLNGCVEIEAVNQDKFLTIAETLTRIGISSKSNLDDELPTLWQSVHLLHKQGRYFLIHFKQLFLLDGKSNKTELEPDDKLRLDNIASMLEQWGLIKTITPVTFTEGVKLCVISHKNRTQWLLKTKYNIGNRQ